MKMWNYQEKTSRTKSGHYSSLCSYSPSSMPFDFYSGNSLKVLGYVRIDFCPEKKIRPSKSFIALLNELCFFSQYLQIITIRAFFGTETELVPSFIWFLIRWQKKHKLHWINTLQSAGKSGLTANPSLYMKTGFSLWSFSHREKPVFIAGVPCNEFRFFPVRKKFTGKTLFSPCNDPVRDCSALN